MNVAAIATVLATISQASRGDDPPPAKAPRLLEFRILATKQHDAAAVLKALAVKGVDSAPAGYRWARLSETVEMFHFADSGVVREVAAAGDRPVKYALIALDSHDLDETGLASIATTPGADGKPGLDLRFTAAGGEKLAALTRAHLPEKNGAFKYHLAILADGVIQAAPAINSVVRDAAVIDGMPHGESAPLVERVNRAIAMKKPK